jgi:hypothetical protein
MKKNYRCYLVMIFAFTAIITLSVTGRHYDDYPHTGAYSDSHGRAESNA